MKGLKNMAVVFALAALTSCAAQEADLLPDPSDPTDLLECDDYQHLELAGSDYEAVSTAPTNDSFATPGVEDQRGVASSSRYSRTVWLGYDDDDEVVGVLTFWEAPGTDDFKFHMRDLYVCTSD